jgi:hypothetical protein
MRPIHATCHARNLATVQLTYRDVIEALRSGEAIEFEAVCWLKLINIVSEAAAKRLFFLTNLNCVSLLQQIYGQVDDVS